MSLTINSSVNALRTMRSLNQTQGTLSETLRRLSSGVRVGVAADDPGRLGSTILAEAQQRGLRQSVRNLNDGLSLSQTLDGALGQIGNALQRLRELGVQAANETYSTADRDALQQEALQMVALIDKAVEQTKFNGIGLLDGSARSIEMFVDQGSSTKALSLDLVKVDTKELTRKASYTSDRRGVYLSDLADGELTINGVAIRATNDADDKLSFSYGSGSAIAKAKAINAVSATTGVTARVGETRVTANRAISAFDLDQSHYFSINGEKIAGFHIDDFDATGHLRDAINSVYTKTGVKAELDAYGQLSFVAEDGRNIQIHYSDMFTMLAVGMADTSGDETNLKGDVLKSTNPAVLNTDELATNFFGSIQSVTSSFESYGGSVTVGGEFNRGDDYQDVVVQVIKSGGYGTAQFRVARETGSEVTPVEDFAFTEVNGPYSTSHSGGMEFFSAATGGQNNGVTGSVTSNGLYDEGANRSYRVVVTSDGTTDGAIKAVGDVYSTVLDTNIEELVATGVTLSGTITLGSLFHQTGENITLTFSGTPRGETVSQSTGATGYSQLINKAGANGVVITGTYTGDIDKTKEIRVVGTGYTQGINAATLQIFDVVGGVSTAVGGPFSITSAVGSAYSIGDGLSVQFTPEARAFNLAQGAVISATGTASSYDSTGLDITLSSSTLQYVGERGNGTYTLNVTKAGRTGIAEYEVLFNGAQIVAPQVLNSGTINIADGITFDVQASTPTIGATTNSVALAGNDNYGDAAADYSSANFVFGGAYTGNLNDATASVRVITEGRVLAAGEANTGDAAVLEYSIGGAVLGTTLARVGTFTVGEGVTFTLNAASVATRLEVASSLATLGTSSVTGNGLTTTLSGALVGYNGDFTLNLDPATFDRNRDLSVRVSELTPVVIGNSAGTVAGSGTLRVELVDAAGAVVKTSDFANVQAGVAKTIDPGLTITFNDGGFTPLSFARTNINGTADAATIALSAGATYNNALNDRDFTFTFSSVNGSSVTQAGNGANATDDTGAASVSGAYTGNFGNQTLGIAFTGTNTAKTSTTVTGADPTSLIGTYNGAQGDQSFTVEFLGGSTATASAVSNTDATFNVAVNTATSTYQGLAGDKNLTVTFGPKSVSSAVTASGGNTGGVTLTTGSTTANWGPTATAFTVSFAAQSTSASVTEVVDTGNITLTATSSAANWSSGPTAFTVTFAAHSTTSSITSSTNTGGLTITTTSGASNWGPTATTFTLNFATANTLNVFDNGALLESINVTAGAGNYSLTAASGIYQGMTLSLSAAGVANATYEVGVNSASTVNLVQNGTVFESFSVVGAGAQTITGAVGAAAKFNGIVLNFSGQANLNDTYKVDVASTSTVDLIQSGVIFESFSVSGAGVQTIAGAGGAAAQFNGMTLTFSGQADLNDSYKVDVTSNQTVSVTDGTNTVNNVATGTNIDLGAGAFSSLGNLAGLRLNIADSTSGAADSFQVALSAAKAKITGALGNATVDISTAANATKTIDLSAHSAIFKGGVDPGVDLQITTPNSARTGTATYSLTTNSTVNLSTARGSVNGVALDGSGNLSLDALSDADMTTLFGGSFTASDSVGVTVAFSSFDNQIDDTYTLTLSKSTSVNVQEVAGAFSTSFNVAQDFGNTTIDLATVLPADPGFDLVITDAVRGFNDTYTLSLTGGQLSMAGTASVADLDVRSLQVNDTFSSALLADEFEIGSRYSLTVTAPLLEAGEKYSVQEFIGTLKTGEEIYVTPVMSAFENTIYTLSNTGSLTLPDGVVLQFSANGTFEVGDEIRFQARGYRGDFSVGGQYTDPAYPTTVEVEVITTGDVDGGAVLRARRLDGGAMGDGGALTVDFNAVSTPNVDFSAIGGPGYIGKGVFMQFDLNNGAGEANRLYAGDKFYIDVVGSLSQNFGAQLILESNKNIEIAYSDLNVDNKIGRMLYVGDPTLTNAPGTLDTLGSAFLGVNTEESIAKINLGTQRGAEEAIRLVDFALEQINSARSNAGAMQNRITQEISSLSTALYQTEVYGSRIKDADFAVEVARQSRALIVQQAGISMLRQVNQQGTYGLQLVQSLLNNG